MELLAIVEEKIKNKVTQLYTEIQDGKFKFYGFAVQDGELIHPSNDVFKIIDLLKLSSNREFIGKRENYDMVLDRESGLLHFFKDEQEDLDKLFMWNGVSAGLVNLGDKPSKGKKHSIRKLNIGNISIICLSIIALKMLLTLPNSYFKVNGEDVNVYDTITYAFSGEEDKFSHAVEASDIRNYIYNTSTITNEKIKDFLWNPELIDDILPYYRGNYLDIIAKIRHNGLDIKDLDGPLKNDFHIAGEYRCGHTIYIRDYDEENFDPKSDQAETIGHEYVHLLQTDAYTFIKESIAELISREYYMNKSSSNDKHRYVEPCKYLMVLMEIIGPEPVWDNAFRQNSTILDDSVSPYLTEEEFKMFKSMMSSSPYFDQETVTKNYSELEKMLNTIHMKKYGVSMYDDPMIKAILTGIPYDRVYFRTSLMAERDSYYYDSECMEFTDAIEQNIIKVYYNIPVTYEQYLKEYSTSYSGQTYIKVQDMCDYSNAVFADNKWQGTIKKDGIEYSIEEAERLGLCEISVNINIREVSLDEYIQDPQNPNFEILQNDQSSCIIDKENKLVTIIKPEKVFVPKISEKFNSNEMIL